MGRYYKIDHKLLFLFGYIFYLFTPYIAGTTNMFPGFPGMDLYQLFFKQIPNNKITMYMIITLSWLPAFYLGHFAFTFIKPQKLSLQLFEATPTSRATSYVGLLLFFLLLLFIYASRASLFGGYASYDIAARGKMSTLLVIFNFFLVYQLVSKQKTSFLLIAGTGITAFLLLSMGGRMYVFQTLIILLVFKTSFAAKPWKLYQIIAVSFGGLVIGSLAGVWRMGESFSIDKAAYSLFAEPVFTWFSTSTFLISNPIPIINMPYNFLTSFLNLIPNTVVSFQPYIVSTHAMGYVYESPLGADSVWSTYIINFGAVGSFFFVFITGFMLHFLRHISEKSRFWAVYYILVCGILPFQFFRDGFYLLNKQLFFNFLLFPILLLYVIKFILYTQQIKPLVSFQKI